MIMDTFEFDSELGLLQIDIRATSKIDLMMIWQKENWSPVDEAKIPIYEMNRIQDIAEDLVYKKRALNNKREQTRVFHTLRTMGHEYGKWLNREG